MSGSMLLSQRSARRCLSARSAHRGAAPRPGGSPPADGDRAHPSPHHPDGRKAVTAYYGIATDAFITTFLRAASKHLTLNGRRDQLCFDFRFWMRSRQEIFRDAAGRVYSHGGPEDFLLASHPEAEIETHLIASSVQSEVFRSRAQERRDESVGSDPVVCGDGLSAVRMMRGWVRAIAICRWTTARSGRCSPMRGTRGQTATSRS